MVEQAEAWGAPERYYAARAFDGSAGSVTTSWEENLNLVVPGCDEAVERAVSLWNQRVRTQLAAETGFQLKGRQVSIHVVSGLPPPLAERLAGDVGIEAVMLNRPLLEAVAGGAAFMAGARDLVRNRDGTTVGSAQPRELDNVRDTASAWLEWADENDVSKRFGEIAEDVFGAYMFRKQQVLIFWLPLGIFAAMHQIPIEAMTVVVLAHELAHAYTHLGCDIDGLDWPMDDFVGSHIAVIEGLAQFYTYIVCRNLRGLLPVAQTTFDTLLGRQHEIYRTHEEWMAQAGGHSGEVVRIGMVEGRRAKKPLEPLQFANAVKAAATRFKAPTPR